MNNKMLAVPLSCLKVGDRIKITTVPSPVKNVAIGAMGIVEAEPTFVAGMEEVRLRLEDNRFITWNVDYLEKISQQADLSQNLGESSSWNQEFSEVKGTQTSIRIDPQFKALIHPLSLEERQQLESNLLSVGCREPLVVWKGRNILLDGHNRFEICQEYEIAFETVEIEMEDRESEIPSS